jgi:transcriptional regulator with XRE-family HTH domain
MMAGHSRWRTLQAKRLAEAGDVREHPEYEQAGRDLRLGDQLRAIRRNRNLTQREVAERAGISQPALSRIELGGGVPDLETLRRLGNAMGVRFHVIVGNEGAEHDENLMVSLAKPRLTGSSTEMFEQHRLRRRRPRGPAGNRRIAARQARRCPRPQQEARR